MEKKLKLDKEVVENLSSEDLSQVQGGNDQYSVGEYCKAGYTSGEYCKAGEGYTSGEYCNAGEGYTSGEYCRAGKG